MNLPKMSGKPIKTTVGGAERLVHPITIGDLAEFEQHCKELDLKAFMEQVSPHLDAAERGQLILQILSRPMLNSQMEAELASMKGVRFIIWRAVSKGDDKFSMEDASNIDNFEEVVEVINGISALGAQANPSAEEDKTEETLPSSGGES